QAPSPGSEPLAEGIRGDIERVIDSDTGETLPEYGWDSPEEFSRSQFMDDLRHGRNLGLNAFQIEALKAVFENQSQIVDEGFAAIDEIMRALESARVDLAAGTALVSIGSLSAIGTALKYKEVALNRGTYAEFGRIVHRFGVREVPRALRILDATDGL